MLATSDKAAVRLCSSGLANATAAKMERYLTGYPGPGIGERYMWFCAADDGPILPEGVPGPMPGPAPGTGGPGPIAPPPPPVGAVWKPPLAAISCLNVAAGGGTELPRERERSFGWCRQSPSGPYCVLNTTKQLVPAYLGKPNRSLYSDMTLDYKTRLLNLCKTTIKAK